MTVTASVTISSEQRTLVGRRRYRFACVRRQQLRGLTAFMICSKIRHIARLHRQKIAMLRTVKTKITALKPHQEAAQEYKTP